MIKDLSTVYIYSTTGKCHSVNRRNHQSGNGSSYFALALPYITMFEPRYVLLMHRLLQCSEKTASPAFALLSSNSNSAAMIVVLYIMMAPLLSSIVDCECYGLCNVRILDITSNHN